MGRSAAIGLVLVAFPALANEIWRGDFEPANLSQFDSYVVHPERWTFVTTPVRQGQRAARIELREGDVGPSNLIRTEVGHTPPMATFQNSERYYAWSSMGSTDFPLQAFDHQLMFWECVAPIYQQEMSLHVNGTTVSFATSPQGGSYQTRWTGQFAHGVWHDFVLHVKWSLDPAVGFVELWYDGTRVLPKTMMRTMHAVKDAMGNDMTPLVSTMHHALFLGNPRAGKPIEVVYLDDVREATTLGDVMAPADAGVDAGVEVDAGMDAGLPADAGALADAGAATDAGAPVDAGAPADAGSTSEPDAGPMPLADAGEADGATGACGCHAAPGALLLAALLALRGRRRPKTS